MPHQRPNSPLGAFLAALREPQIKCLLIGGMAAVEQGVPITALDYDLWYRQQACLGPRQRFCRFAGSRASVALGSPTQVPSLVTCLLLE